MYRKKLLLQWSLLEMHHVLLDIAAVYNCVLMFQRLNLGSARKCIVTNLESFAMSASFGSGERTCHMLPMLKWVSLDVITILPICMRLKSGPTPDLDTCCCLLLSWLWSQVSTAASNGQRLLQWLLSHSCQPSPAPGIPLLSPRPEMPYPGSAPHTAMGQITFVPSICFSSFPASFLSPPPPLATLGWHALLN